MATLVSSVGNETSHGPSLFQQNTLRWSAIMFSRFHPHIYSWSVFGATGSEANLHAFERIFNQISTDANCMDEATKQASEALQKRDRGRTW